MTAITTSWSSSSAWAWRALRYDQTTFWRTPGPFFQIGLPAMMLLIFGSMNEDAVELAGQSYTNYLTVGMATFTVTTGAYGGMAVRMTYRRETGIFQRLRTTPLPPSALIAGNVGSALVVVLAGITSVLVTGVAVFDASLPSNWPLFVAGVLLGAIACGSLGILLSSFVKSLEGVDAMVWATVMPVLFISGAFQHVEPGSLLARVADLFPPRHALALIGEGSGVPAVGGSEPVHIAILLGWTAFGITLGARRFRWEPSRA